MVNYDIVPRSNRVVGGGMPSRSGICAGVALGTLIAVPLLVATPKLTPVQAAALFKAAGFPIGADKHPVNRCGQQADPRVLFDDMNDDGRAEAIFIDQDRKSGVEGKSVSVRVDLGGVRTIKKKKENKQRDTT